MLNTRVMPIQVDDDATALASSAPKGAQCSTGLYRLLVETVRDYAIFALDTEGKVLSWNAGAERLKGYRPVEIIGRHYSTFYPPEEIAAGRPDRQLEAAARDGRIELDGWRLQKDGGRFWANVVITALRDPAGELVGFAKVTRDLTERRRAEETLRHSEERFRLLVQSVHDYAIFMLDRDGRVVSWNDGAERINGYTAEEIVGRHFAIFYPAEDVAAGKTSRELQIAAEQGTYEEDGWRVRKDGTSFWASVLITAVRGVDGELIGYAKVTRDLTERRAAHERALADARRIAEAKAAARTKSEFLTAMSHELRTPINATLGYADLLEMEIAGALNERQRDYLGRIRGTQQHLLRIINDLLDFGRIESQQVECDYSVESLHEMVEAVVPMVMPQAMVKGIEVEGRYHDGALNCRADRPKVEQIVLNLLGNAVKFTPVGGRIVVTTEIVSGAAVVSVTDNGPGVSIDQQAAIFEPFVQLGRTLTSGHEGTGLGLAISRDLARAMGGDVTIQSAPNEGATFSLRLPLS